MIVTVPAEIPVTTPALSIVATALLELLHVPPLVALDNVVVDPSHTDVVPVIDPRTGRAFTVTVVVTVEVQVPLEYV